MLPEGVEYVAGSAKDGDTPIADPDVKQGVVTFRIGEPPSGDWSMDLAFDARPTQPNERALETSAVVIFETPVEKNAKTPVAKTLLQGESSAGSGNQVVETLGLRPGEEWQTAVAPKLDDAPPKPGVFNKTWLEQAKPGLEWLAPEPGFAAAIASVNIAIKHAPGTTLELSQNGIPVPKFNFEGAFSNNAKTVSLSRWRGVDLVDGDHDRLHAGTAHLVDSGGRDPGIDARGTEPPWRRRPGGRGSSGRPAEAATTQDVEVKVEHGLARIFTVVDHTR